MLNTGEEIKQNSFSALGPQESPNKRDKTKGEILPEAAKSTQRAHIAVITEVAQGGEM